MQCCGIWPELLRFQLQGQLDFWIHPCKDSMICSLHVDCSGEMRCGAAAVSEAARGQVGDSWETGGPSDKECRWAPA